MPHKDPEKRRAYAREYNKNWRTRNPEKWKEIWSASKEKHKEAYLKRRRAYLKRYYRRVRKEALEKYGGECACCGIKDIEFLVIDHVNGGGNKERRIIKSVRTFYNKLYKEPIDQKYQVLCHNCNCAKAFHLICPHQRKKGYCSPESQGV